MSKTGAEACREHLRVGGYEVGEVIQFADDGEWGLTVRVGGVWCGFSDINDIGLLPLVEQLTSERLDTMR